MPFSASNADRDDLIAFLDGEAPAPVADRIRANPDLRAAADGYARTQRALQRRLYRFDCPSPQELGEYDLGLLAPAERTRVAAHIVECPRCTEEVQTLRAFLADEPEPAAPGILTQMRRVVASLLPAPAPLASLRGADTGATQTYQADDVTIALDVTVARGRATVTGLLWRDGTEPGPFVGSIVALLSGDALIQTTTLDDLGNFTFDDIAPGTYTVEVTLGDDRIALEGVHIGS